MCQIAEKIQGRSLNQYNVASQVRLLKIQILGILFCQHVFGNYSFTKLYLSESKKSFTLR